MRLTWLTAAVLLIAASVDAHVRVTPRESKPGATETYTVRVPTEGKVATTSVQLDVPEGVAIVSVAEAVGASADLTREGERVVAITWRLDIKPGEAGEVSFVAQNPRGAEEIVWKVHQRYADGTTSEWVGPAGSRGPAPVTKLLP